MDFKFLIFAGSLTIATADFIPSEPYNPSPLFEKYASPVILDDFSPAVTKTVLPKHYGKSHYAYSYGVYDGNTGDNKQHEESRDGDLVKGSYSLVEPDGSRRTVHYTADSNGFNAVVNKHNPFSGSSKTVVAPVKISPIMYDNYQMLPKENAPVPFSKYGPPAASSSGTYNYAAPAVTKSIELASYTQSNYVTPAPNYVTPVSNYMVPKVSQSVSVPHTVYGVPFAKAAVTKVASVISKVPKPSFNYGVPHFRSSTPVVPKVHRYTVTPVSNSVHPVRHSSFRSSVRSKVHSAGLGAYRNVEPSRQVHRVPAKKYGVPSFNKFSPSVNYRGSGYYN